MYKPLYLFIPVSFSLLSTIPKKRTKNVCMFYYGHAPSRVWAVTERRHENKGVVSAGRPPFLLLVVKCLPCQQGGFDELTEGI